MSKNEIIWVVVNTNSQKEARSLGLSALKKRLCACYKILPILEAGFYWPPKKGKIAKSKGPLLTLETLESKYQEIVKFIKSHHSDKLPLIGQWEIENVEKDFYNWMKEEINSASSHRTNGSFGRLLIAKNFHSSTKGYLGRRWIK